MPPTYRTVRLDDETEAMATILGSDAGDGDRPVIGLSFSSGSLDLVMTLDASSCDKLARLLDATAHQARDAEER